MIISHHSSLRRISVRCVRCSVSWHPKPCTDFKKTQLHHFYSTVVCYFVYWITIDHLLKILIFVWQQGHRVAELRNLLTPNIDIYNHNRTQAMYGPTSMQGISLCPKSHCSLCLLALKVLAAKQSMQCSFRSFWRCLSDCLITAVQSCLIMNISATELPNFIRKYYLLHKLLILNRWRQHIFSFQYNVRYCSQALRRPEVTLFRSVMASVVVSTLERIDLFFIDPGTKVNGQYYRDILLRQQLLPAIRGLSGDFCTFDRTTLLPTEHWDSVSVNSWNIRFHHSSSVAS